MKRTTYIIFGMLLAGCDSGARSCEMAGIGRADVDDINIPVCNHVRLTGIHPADAEGFRGRVCRLPVRRAYTDDFRPVWQVIKVWKIGERVQVSLAHEAEAAQSDPNTLFHGVSSSSCSSSGSGKRMSRRPGRQKPSTLPRCMAPKMRCRSPRLFRSSVRRSCFMFSRSVCSLAGQADGTTGSASAAA